MKHKLTQSSVRELHHLGYIKVGRGANAQFWMGMLDKNVGDIATALSFHKRRKWECWNAVVEGGSWFAC